MASEHRDDTDLLGSSLGPEGTAGPIARKLAQALDLYGGGRENEAVLLWKHVLELDPRNPQAKEYLDSALAVRAATARVIQLEAERHHRSGDCTDTPLDDPGFVAAVAEGEYEKALAHLFEARSRCPDDGAVSRSIKHLKIRLLRRYSRRLGSMDLVPHRVSEDVDLDVEGYEIWEFVDGIASYEDIFACSTLGRYQTSLVLLQLLEAGLIEAVEPSSTGMPAAPAIFARPSQVGKRPDDPPKPEGESSSVTVARPEEDEVSGTARVPRTFRVPSPANLKPSGAPPAQRAAESAVRLATPPPAAQPPATPPPAAQPPPSPASAPRAEPEPSPPQESVEAEYTRTFSEATRAYMRRDYENARALFTRCLELRPGDRRAQVNLDRIPSKR